jgi:nucleoside-diphosphate-sugar epimerase
MRIVITGASGNVGTAVLRRLAGEPDVDVLGISRRPPLPGAGEPYDGVEWRALDLGEPSAARTLAGWLSGADAVIHLAWQIQPSHDRARLRRTNVTGTANLLEAMRAAGAGALLYASSVGAYSPGPKDRCVAEDWPTGGVAGSGYSVDKAAVERLLDDADRDLRIVRMRQALVFQHDAGSEITRYFLGPLVPTSLLRWRRLPLVPANPRLRAQAVHAEDVAEAYAIALRRDVRGAFNLAADPVLDGPTVAAELGGRTVPVPVPAVKALAAASWRARLQPSEPGWIDLAAAAPLMDVSRAHAELDWSPRHDAIHALRDLMAGMAAAAGTSSAALRGGAHHLRRLVGSLPGHRDPA